MQSQNDVKSFLPLICNVNSIVSIILQSCNLQYHMLHICYIICCVYAVLRVLHIYTCTLKCSNSISSCKMSIRVRDLRDDKQEGPSFFEF